MYKFFLFGLFFLLSCSSNKIIKGRYVYKGVYGIFYSMQLNDDSSFSYYWRNGLNSDTVNGFWRKNHNKIFITTNEQPPQLINVQETFCSECDSTRIHVITNDGIDLPDYLIKINDSAVLQADGNGVLILNNNMLRKFEITYSPGRSVAYNIGYFKNNIFDVVLNYQITPQIFFNNHEVRIKKSKLIIVGSEPKKLILKRVM